VAEVIEEGVSVSVHALEIGWRRTDRALRANDNVADVISEAVVDRVLIRELSKKLHAAADPARAPGMQAYMKSSMPYLGVSSVPLKTITREVFKTHLFEDANEWRDTALELWRKAKYREERYAAIILTDVKRYAPFRTLEVLPMYEEMIVDGAWWDYVDFLATHGLGDLIKKYPRQMKKEMLVWAKGADMWKRRSAILCQLKLKQEQDLELLYACIEPSITSKEFFLRKAIGWALRDLAWYDPEEVIRYVKKRKNELSGLSKREALKNVLKSGKIAALP
jgi:3-methyladenine DNA glycosylase AlkD